MLVVFYTSQQFFFLATVKAGKEFGMLVGMMIMIALGIESLGIDFKSHSVPVVHNYSGLAFIGLLDILYILAMTPAVANTSALAASVYLQGSIVAKVVFMVFLSGHTFRITHYVGVIIIAGCIVLNCAFYSSPSIVFLLGALVISAISQMLKMKYVRKHICSPLTFNKYTLMISTLLGCILTPLFLSISGDDIGSYLSSGFECIFELECSGLLIYLVGLLICASIYHAILYRVRSYVDYEGDKYI